MKSLSRSTTLAGLFLVIGFCSLNGQEPPVSVVVIQHIDFGAFFNGPAGGAVTVTNEGMRKVSGDVMPAYLRSWSPVVLDVQAAPGTVITLLPEKAIQLTGSKGGAMSLTLGEPDQGRSFVISGHEQQNTQVRIGGTLTVEAAQSLPAGDYGGEFSITFFYQ